MTHDVFFGWVLALSLCLMLFTLTIMVIAFVIFEILIPMIRNFMNERRKHGNS